MGKLKLKVNNRRLKIDKYRFFFTICKNLTNPFTKEKESKLINMGRVPVSLKMDVLESVKQASYNSNGNLQYYYQNSQSLNYYQSIAIAVCLHFPELTNDEAISLTLKVGFFYKKDILNFYKSEITKKLKEKYLKASKDRILRELMHRGYRAKGGDKRYMEGPGFIGWEHMAFPVPIHNEEDSKKLFKYVGIKQITKIRWKSSKR